MLRGGPDYSAEGASVPRPGVLSSMAAGVASAATAVKVGVWGGRRRVGEVSVLLLGASLWGKGNGGRFCMCAVLWCGCNLGKVSAVSAGGAHTLLAE